MMAYYNIMMAYYITSTLVCVFVYRYKVKVVRKTLQQLSTEATLNSRQELFV